MGLAGPVIARALKECEDCLVAAKACDDAKICAEYTLAAKNAASVYLTLTQADATREKARAER